MTPAQAAQLKAATRHATATVNLWQAQRDELASSEAWAGEVARHGPGSPHAESARVAFMARASDRELRARELDEASHALSAAMLAVHQEARR
ncbi:hypothetical protein [Myxococcus sp. RHSTA-1-4]|uniref:hypothetical protein n=1 Tax=Myxococcus sp. RHSTA-1-4 TaxID=2874601 RepID=UPI001CBC637C|nr:hypothetical protein [Myxococcus sp. RHSTA-1-4]MBZ4422013.1 hypothetical protein [Myxococcus sp. RHSTA-1-4]